MFFEDLFTGYDGLTFCGLHDLLRKLRIFLYIFLARFIKVGRASKHSSRTQNSVLIGVNLITIIDLHRFETKILEVYFNFD